MAFLGLLPSNRAVIADLTDGLLLLLLLGLHDAQEFQEPLERLLVAVDPEKVHLPKTLHRLAEIGQPSQMAPGALPFRLAIPEHERLQDGGEGGDTDAGGDEDGVLGLEDVARGSAERSVQVDLQHVLLLLAVLVLVLHGPDAVVQDEVEPVGGVAVPDHLVGAGAVVARRRLLVAVGMLLLFSILHRASAKK